MRKEPFGVDDYVHVIKRGVRGLPIVRDENDRWRFLKILRHLNDEYTAERWEEDTHFLSAGKRERVFGRPLSWPEESPLVGIAAYTLLSNHFHLLLRELQEGGIARFMQKLGNSMTGHYNLKYQESGSLFQGAYRAKRIHDDDYFRYVAVYIMVKNTFELYPGGLKRAALEFDSAFTWASSYPFSSLGDYAGNSQVRPAKSLLTDTLIAETFPSAGDFKEFARDCILGRIFDDTDTAGFLNEADIFAQVRPANL